MYNSNMCKKSVAIVKGGIKGATANQTFSKNTFTKTRKSHNLITKVTS